MRNLTAEAMSVGAKDLLGNLNEVVASNGLAGLANILSTIWFARVLGPAIIGDYAVLVVSLQLVTACLVPGFNQALIRAPHQKPLVAAATFATSAQSLILLLMGGIICGWSFWSSTAVWDLAVPGGVLGISLIISFWSNLLASPLEAGMAYRALSRMRLVAVGVSIVVGVIGAAQDWGIYALVLRDLCAATVTLALVQRTSPLHLGLQGWRQGLRDLLRFSSGLWALNTLEKLALRLDYALVGVFFDKEIMGIYFAVRGLIEGALGFLVSPIQTVLYSFYCKVHLPAQVRSKLIQGALLLCAGIGALECLFFFVGPWLVQSVFSEKYRSGEVLFMGLVLYAGAMLWFENLKVMAMSRNMHRILVLPRLAQLATTLATTVLLIKVAGLRGAGLAAGLSACLLALVSTWQVCPQAAIPDSRRSGEKVGELAA